MPSNRVEEGEGQEEDVTQFHVEMEEGGEAPGVISEQLAAVHSQRPVMLNETAEKLDIMMSICFEYLHTHCHTNGTKQKAVVCLCLQWDWCLGVVEW